MMITALKRKVTRFALSPVGANGAPPSAAAGAVIEDAYRALLSVGHNPADARARLDAVLAGGKTYESVEALLTAIYSKG